MVSNYVAPYYGVVGFLPYELSIMVYLSTQTPHSLVTAPKAGLFKFKMLKMFRMELEYKDDFVTECILTNISRPPEELVLMGFDFSRECMHVCQVCVYCPHDIVLFRATCMWIIISCA